MEENIQSSTSTLSVAVHEINKNPNKWTHEYQPNKMKNDRSQHKCIFCNAHHYSDTCKKYPTRKERKLKLYEMRRCFKCLKEGHMAKHCWSPARICFHCNSVKDHHRSLCPSKFPEQVLSSVEEIKKDHPTILTHDVNNIVDQQSAGIVQSSIGTPATMTMIATVTVRNPNDSNKKKLVRLFLDAGSHKSFGVEGLIRDLELPILSQETLLVNTFASNNPIQLTSNVVLMDLVLKDGKTMPIILNSVKSITNQTRYPLTKEDMNHLGKGPKQNLADEIPRRHEKVPVDVLIGIDYFWEIVGGNDKKNLPSGLSLIPSKVGLLLCGPYKEQRPMEVNQCLIEIHRPASQVPEEKMMKSNEKNQNQNQMPLEETKQRACLMKKTISKNTLRMIWIVLLIFLALGGYWQIISHCSEKTTQFAPFISAACAKKAAPIVAMTMFAPFTSAAQRLSTHSLIPPICLHMMTYK